MGSPLTGNISVAFDAAFSGNNIVYAAGDKANNGIYSFTIGESTAWKAIDSTIPSGAMIGSLGVSENGVLYAVNFQQVDTAGIKGGIERCLVPSSKPLFETVTPGLDIKTTLNGLRFSENTVWTIDTTHNYLMQYTDSLSEAVNLISPADNSPVTGTVSENTVKSILLDWEALAGATNYQWQLSDDENFFSSSIISEGTTTAGSVKQSFLEIDTAYYWRVRAVNPVSSFWSEIWSFTPYRIVELIPPELETPSAGAISVPVNTMFQWTSVAGAEGYELEVSEQYDFSDAVIRLTGEDALPVNAWQSDVPLGYNTTYYWRVRAVNPETASAWSGVGVFATESDTPTQTSITSTASTTQSATTETVTAVVETTTTTISPEFPIITIIQSQATAPSYNEMFTVPDWLYYLLGFMALFIVLLLATIILMMIKRG